MLAYKTNNKFPFTQYIPVIRRPKTLFFLNLSPIVSNHQPY